MASNWRDAGQAGIPNINNCKTMSTHQESPWDVSAENFPFEGSDRDKLAFMLRYAILAPSSHNSQPWIFEISGDAEIRLYADYGRSLPIADPDDRFLVISCGAALGHLVVAARYFGYAVNIKVRPELRRPDLLAVVSFTENGEASDDDGALFRAIRHRHTNRLGFEEREIAEPVLHYLQAIVDDRGGWLARVPAARRGEVAELVAAGDRLQHADPLFRSELAHWMRPNSEDARDGMPGYAIGMGNFMAAGASFMVRTFNMGPTVAQKDYNKALKAPALLVLGTEGDTVDDWLTAGFALSHLLLSATLQGLTAAFLNQPIELEELRPKLAEIVPAEGYPQLMLYMGYAEEGKASPRRDLDEVVVSAQQKRPDGILRDKSI